MARTITVTSGKGGVGKTNISVNLAIQLASLGYRTCLFDADLGLANINILLGLYPEHNLEDVVLNNKTIRDIIIRDYDGMDIIPGSSGIEKMADLEYQQINPLVRSFSEFDSYDFFLFDTSSGVSKNVISFCRASSEVMLIVTPEPTSLSDAYGLLKILSLNGFNGQVMVVVNQSRNAKIANTAYTKLKKTVHKYLPINIVPLGVIVHDDHVVEALKEQKPFISLYPNSNVSKCIKNIAKRLVERGADDIEAYGLETFWTRFLSFFKNPLKFAGMKNVGELKEPQYSSQEERKTQTGQPAINRGLTAYTADTASSSEQARFPETSNIEHMVQENCTLLTRLEESISSISKDLRAIRRVIENGNRSYPKEPLPEHDVINNSKEGRSESQNGSRSM
jgi:flagellar biosynthesis protein FlhG